MIARIWRGVVDTARAAEYARYVEATGVGAYRQTPGNEVAYTLTRDLLDGTTEVVAFSVWVDVAAVRRFAGEDIDAMVLYPEDDDYLLAPPSLTHHHVAEPYPVGVQHPGAAP
jgi:hypothetical protein